MSTAAVLLMAREVNDAGTSTPRATYHALIVRGIAPGEAANLTATLYGLSSADFKEPWTIKAVCELHFLRHMHRTGRLDG